jgi:hypothetical protein
MRRLPVLAMLLLTGCVDLSPGKWFDRHPETAQVPGNAFASVPTPAPVAQASYAPAGVESAARVDQVGQKVVLASETGLRPVFMTVGDPRPRISHQGTSVVVITEGLVRQCSSEGQLAALLCTELGKMVSEREVLAAAQARQPEREPPIEVRIGNDSSSMFGRTSDMVRAAELARSDPDRRRAMAPPPLPPDPHVLAALYLKKAGYPAADLDAVAPLLSAAGK